MISLSEENEFWFSQNNKIYDLEIMAKKNVTASFAVLSVFVSM